MNLVVKKKRAANTNLGAKTNNILLTGFQNLSHNAQLKTPLNNSLKRTIQRQRRVYLPPEPATLGQIILAYPWTTTGGITQLPFLIHDSGPQAGANRIIVFAANDALDHLASCDTWFMDGNFKVSPIIFDQIYVIRAKLDTGAISCVYAFLPGKEQVMYAELFQALQTEFNRLGIAWNLTTVTCDYERGAYNALRQTFGGNLRVVGCFFHLKQSTFRKAVELGLRQYIVDGSPTLDHNI